MYRWMTFALLSLVTTIVLFRSRANGTEYAFYPTDELVRNAEFIGVVRTNGVSKDRNCIVLESWKGESKGNRIVIAGLDRVGSGEKVFVFASREYESKVASTNLQSGEIIAEPEASHADYFVDHYQGYLQLEKPEEMGDFSRFGSQETSWAKFRSSIRRITSMTSDDLEKYFISAKLIRHFSSLCERWLEVELRMTDFVCFNGKMDGNLLRAATSPMPLKEFLWDIYTFQKVLKEPPLDSREHDHLSHIIVENGGEGALRVSLEFQKSNIPHPPRLEWIIQMLRERQSKDAEAFRNLRPIKRF